MKLGEMKENRITRLIRIIKGAYFLIINPMFVPIPDTSEG
jgi:hypothetical protein